MRVRFLITKLRNVLRMISPGVIVLAYHRIAEFNNDPSGLIVSPQNFQAQLIYLRKKFKILNTNEMIRYLHRDIKLAKSAVCLTFDDGYSDNYRNALPILEKYKCPAIFFITTGWIGNRREFWWDEIQKLIYYTTTPQKLYFSFGNINVPIFLKDMCQRDIFYRKIIDFLRYQNEETKKAFITGFATAIGARLENNPVNLPMTEKELIQVAESPFIEIGAHTVSHEPLSILPIQRQIYEIEESKRYLEKLLGKKIRCFAYPFGTREDFSEETVGLIKKSGYELAFTTTKEVFRYGVNPFNIGRFIVRNWTVNEFAEHLSNWEMM